jgi:tRNA(Ile)-lysidine synthase
MVAESAGLLPRVRNLLAEFPDLLAPESVVLVALSGGPDSMVLLHLLARLAPVLRLRILAAHFDHGLRPESAAEADRVVLRAAELDVPCLVGTPPRPLSSSQATLRSARYGWLRRTQREVGAQRVATGHQADDQAETVLFRIMRGTGIPGLTGIPLRRGTIVRPLLPFRRHEIMSYLRAHDLEWIDDSSNEDPRWARGRIRTQVMPALERQAPDVVPRLLALSAAAARTDRLLQACTDLLLERANAESPPTRRRAVDRNGVVLLRDPLASAPGELQAHVVRSVARHLDRTLTAGGTRAGVEFISEGRSGSRVAIGGGLQIVREYDRIIIGPGEREGGPAETMVPRGSEGEGTVRVNGRPVAVRWRQAGRVEPATGHIAVAVPRGHYPLRLRGWRSGDRMRLPTGTRKLKKLFGDRRIPLGERSRLSVLVDAAERVLWVPGIAVAAREPHVEYEEAVLELELRDG